MSGIIYYLQLWCVFIMISCQTVTNTSSDLNSSRALSRRKRFIIFAEGSSFQLGKSCAINEVFITHDNK